MNTPSELSQHGFGFFEIFAEFGEFGVGGLFLGVDFVDFVADTGVTVLGVIPSIVAAWRTAGVLDDSPWSRVRVISSTGEASVPADCAWLMAHAGGVPVIEY